MPWHLILIIVAIVLFILAGLGVSPRGYSLGWFGLAFLATSFLIGN